MQFLRRNRRTPDESTPAITPPVIASERAIDLARLDRLYETSVRLHDLGVDYEEIQRRASADGVSLNDALEAIDRERSDG